MIDWYIKTYQNLDRAVGHFFENMWETLKILVSGRR